MHARSSFTRETFINAGTREYEELFTLFDDPVLTERGTKVTFVREGTHTSFVRRTIRYANRAVSALASSYPVNCWARFFRPPFLHWETVEIIDASWLFTRGDESVRVERISLLRRGLRLIISGPGHSRDTHEFSDVDDCTSLQSMFERRLRALGFHLEAFSNRRGARDRRREPRGQDRRH